LGCGVCILYEAVRDVVAHHDGVEEPTLGHFRGYCPLVIGKPDPTMRNRLEFARTTRAMPANRVVFFSMYKKSELPRRWVEADSKSNCERKKMCHGH
jgi:hypothetical protein